MKILQLVGGLFNTVATIVTSAGAADADKIPSTDAAGRLDASFMPGGAPVSTSAGAADAGKLPKLDAAGRLDNTMMPTGIGADTRSVIASESLSAGNLVNLWNNSGTINVRKADATVAGKQAHGYVLSAVSASASATVYFDGTISGLSGLTVGSTYWLHTTAGGLTTTAPSATGNVVQTVGIAVSTTELLFEEGTPVILA